MCVSLCTTVVYNTTQNSYALAKARAVCCSNKLIIGLLPNVNSIELCHECFMWHKMKDDELCVTSSSSQKLCYWSVGVTFTVKK